MAAAEPSDYKIEILGISWSSTAFSELMTAGRDLPWMQDISGGDVTTNWGANYRDFVILDPANGKTLAAYNLSANPLSIAANREQLTDILLAAAGLKDEDGDLLSDYWEDEMFGADHSPGPADDPDHDRSTVFSEYALGSRADSAASLPNIVTGTVMIGANEYQTITFRRRLGASGGLQYLVEVSEDYLTWSSALGQAFPIQLINPYDGTGTELITYRSARPMSDGGGALRVRVVRP